MIMGLFSRIRAAVGGAEVASAPVDRAEPTLSAAAPNDLQNPNAWSVTTVGGRSSTGVRVNEGTALTLPAAMQALRILTGVFAMTPMIYYRRLPSGGKERATDSPLYTLFKDRPNKAQTAFAWKELLLSDIVLAGRYASYISRDFRQRPVALTRLDPRLVVVNYAFDRATGSELFFDATLPDGARERFTSAEVWHVPGFSRDGLTGLDVITYMREALGGGLATQEYANRFFSNGATPPMVLTTPSPVPQEAKDKIRSDWHDRVGGLRNAHDIAVLDRGLKPETLGGDNEKSQFLETRTFQVLDVSRAFGVPPHLVFELSKATFSNIEQQSLEFLLYHMGPHYERVAQAANAAFAEDGHFFEFLPDALLKGDIKTRYEAYRMARDMGVLNADEIRARENLNAIGGDVGEAYLWPANFNKAGATPDDTQQ